MSKGRSDPWIVVAGLIGGFLTGGFVALVNASVLLAVTSTRLGYVGVTVAGVALGVAMAAPLARWGWLLAAVGSIVLVLVVPTIDGGNELSALVIAAAVGLMLGGLLLHLRMVGPSERTWAVAAFAVGLVTAGGVVFGSIARAHPSPGVEAGGYVAGYGVAAYMVWSGSRRTAAPFRSRWPDWLVVVGGGGVATTIAVLLDRTPPAVQGVSLLRAPVSAAPSWYVYTSWAVTVALLGVFAVAAVARTGWAGGRVIVVMSVAAPPLLTQFESGRAVDDVVVTLTVAAAIVVAWALVRWFDALVPWEAVGLLVAGVGLIAPSLAGDRAFATPSPDLFSTLTVLVGLALAMGAVLVRLTTGGAVRSGEAWLVVGIAVAAVITARELLFPPTLIVAYLHAAPGFPDVRVWLAVTLVISALLFVADRVEASRRRRIGPQIRPKRHLTAPAPAPAPRSEPAVSRAGRVL